MKKTGIIFFLSFLVSQGSGEVFSAKNFHNTVEKNIEEKNIQENIQENFQEEYIEEKNNVEEIANLEKNSGIFFNIPDVNKKIINIFLKKFEDKNFFNHIQKISYRKNSLNRGLASGNKIYFDFQKIDTNEEFKRVMTHEMGHVFDLGYLKSKEKKIISNFKDGSKKIYADDPSVEFYSLCFKSELEQNGNCETKDFPSKYGKTDPFEDFAESFLLYVENNESFKLMTLESEIMKKKYDFIEKYLGPIESGQYPEQKKGMRVWDLTIIY